MATKPTPGASDGTWGTEMNTFLEVSLDVNGKIATEALQTDSTAPTADAALANKKYVDDTKTGTADLTISTTAFAGNPVSTVTSWTDIDLSAIVGTNAALVYLRIVQVGGATTDIAFRTNGASVSVGMDSNSTYGAGVSAVTLADNNIGYVLVLTDSSGIMEHKAGASGTGETYNIFVEAFMIVN